MTRTNRMIRTAVIGCAVLWLAAGRLAAAQAGPDGKASPRVRENLITLKLLRMTQALDLTTDQASAIYPVLTRLETEKYGVTRKLNAAMKDLELLVGEERPDEARLTELMSAIDGWRERLAEIERETSDFLVTKLSVVQRAKYVLFSAEFYRRLGERLGELRGRLRNRFTN